MRSFVEYSKVPDKYRLSFVVGEIVRNDVWVENETKVLFNRLRAGGLPSDPMLRDFGKVIPQVRRTLMLPGYVIRIRLNLSVLASMCCSLLKPARVAFRKTPAQVLSVVQVRVSRCNCPHADPTFPPCLQARIPIIDPAREGQQNS